MGLQAIEYLTRHADEETYLHSGIAIEMRSFCFPKFHSWTVGSTAVSCYDSCEILTQYRELILTLHREMTGTTTFLFLLLDIGQKCTESCAPVSPPYFLCNILVGLLQSFGEGALSPLGKCWSVFHLNINLALHIIVCNITTLCED